MSIHDFQLQFICAKIFRMNRKVVAIVLAVVGVVVIVGGAVMSYVNSQRPNAGLKIDTNPPELDKRKGGTIKCEM